MTRDDVIRLAKEAGITQKLMTIDGVEYEYRHAEFNDNIGGDEFGCIERFAALVAEALQEERAKDRGTLMFNPYTGWARDPADIRSDPHGILLLDPEQPIHAAAIRARKP